MNSYNSVEQKKCQKGFTLIELMIAISILSLLLFTGTYSYSMLAERWNKELGTFSQSANRAKNLQLLQNVFDGIMPYVVVDKNKKASFFFIGHSDSLLSVTRKGLFSGKFPEIFRITSIETAQGTYDIVYQASSTEHLLLKGTDQVVDFNYQITLFKSLKKAEFNYFGFEHLFDKSSFNAAKQQKWQTNYSGIDKKLIPEKVNLQLMTEQGELAIYSVLDANVEFLLTPYSDSNL